MLHQYSICDPGRVRIFILGFFFVSLAILARPGALFGQTTQVFTGNEYQIISLADAQKLIGAFQSTTPPQAIKADYFAREGILSLLKQPTCVGVRVYFGTKPDGALALVLVGVDDTNGDMTSGVLLDNGFPCPPYCDTVRIISH